MVICCYVYCFFVVVVCAQRIPDKSMVLFHACAHNPTGADLTVSQPSELSNSQHILFEAHLPFCGIGFYGNCGAGVGGLLLWSMSLWKADKTTLFSLHFWWSVDSLSFTGVNNASLCSDVFLAIFSGMALCCAGDG